jgi:hypothetical protein
MGRVWVVGRGRALEHRVAFWKVCCIVDSAGCVLTIVVVWEHDGFLRALQKTARDSLCTALPAN